MRHAFFEWASSRRWCEEAERSLAESAVCYRAGAYRAALLFSYLGFMSEIRERLLTSDPPAGLPSAIWTNIQSAVSSSDTWDRGTFEATQRKNPAPVFPVPQSVRDEFLYWKDRRNDCAHSKSNEIAAEHVETFHAFIRSRIDQVFVNGGVPALLTALSRHFNPIYTPPGASAVHLVERLVSASSPNEVPTFLDDYESQASSASPVSPLVGAYPTSVTSFIATLMESHFEEHKRRAFEWLKDRDPRLPEYLRRHPSDSSLLHADPQIIRRLWREQLSYSQASDTAVLSSLIRASLIPAGETGELVQILNEKGVATRVDNQDYEIFEQIGFFDELERLAYLESKIGDFDWANRRATVIVQGLERRQITNEIAGPIATEFNSRYHPHDVAAELNKSLRRDPHFVAKLSQAINNAGMRTPEYLDIPSPAPAVPFDAST